VKREAVLPLFLGEDLRSLRSSSSLSQREREGKEWRQEGMGDLLFWKDLIPVT